MPLSVVSCGGSPSGHGHDRILILNNKRKSSVFWQRRPHFCRAAASSAAATTRKVLVLFWAMVMVLMMPYPPSIPPPPFGLYYGVVNAKEIQATKEWTLIGENDTIDSGMHVRMDLSTGEKWVKLLDDEHDNENDEQSVQQVSITSSGGVAVVATTTLPTSTENNQQQQQEQQKHHDDMPASSEPEYDYDMMHRLLSKLPPEEHERMGGLPKMIPELGTSNDTKNTRTPLTTRERELFEARMRQIWLQRQAELQQVQDELVVDLPRILKNRIASIRQYLDNPMTILQQQMELKAEMDDDDDDDDVDIDGQGDTKDDDDDTSKYMISPHNLVALLADLEFHLTDLDMTRDFHTLGGWPLLASLVSPHVHYYDLSNDSNSSSSNSSGNETSSSSSSFADEDIPPVHDKILVIRAHAAWALGTAVKNIGEFRPWVLEPMPAVALVANNSNHSDQTSSSSSSKNATTTIEFMTTTTTPLNLVVQALLEAGSKSSSTANVSSNSATTTTTTTTGKDTLKYQQQLAQKTLYALGSFLRGNPLAQVAFSTMSIMTNDYNESNNSNSKQSPVAQLLGSLIAEWVQEAADSSSSSSSSSSSMQHAIKMSTRLLSLADDIVNDVQLHADDDSRRTLTSPEQDAKIMAAFSTRDWCLAAMQGATVSSSSSSSLQAESLRALVTLGPHCASFYNSKHVVDLAMALRQAHSNDDNDNDSERMKLFEAAIQVVSIALHTKNRP